MAVMTGTDGALRLGGSAVCRVRNWSLSITRDALDVTCLGSEWRDYVSGLKGATGSATLLYDPQESAAVTMLNSVLTPGSSATPISVSFVLSTGSGRQLTAEALVTSVSPSVSVGEVSTADVQFQVTGALAGAF